MGNKEDYRDDIERLIEKQNQEKDLEEQMKRAHPGLAKAPLSPCPYDGKPCPTPAKGCEATNFGSASSSGKEETLWRCQRLPQ